MSELKFKRSEVSGLMRNYRAEKLAFQILSKSTMLSMIGQKTNPIMLWVSQSWSDYLGWPQEYLIGVNFFDLIHPDDMSINVKAFSKFQETGKIGFEGEYFINRYRCQDGKYKRVKWHNVMPTDNDLYMIIADPIDYKLNDK